MECIGKRTLKEMKSTHPWMTQQVVEAKARKREAEGTEHEKAMTEACGQVILEARTAYTERTKKELDELKRGSKKWCKKSAELLGAQSRVCNIPALRDDVGRFAMDPPDKAKLLAKTWQDKSNLPPKEANTYTQIPPTEFVQEILFFPTVEMAFKELDSLRTDSGTGPDGCPSKILQYCARELALPVAMLTMRILASMQWPDSWREHWIIPIHKKLATFLPSNYRGVHLTAQLSKVVERLIKQMLDPYLERTIAYGTNQFAYRKNGDHVMS